MVLRTYGNDVCCNYISGNNRAFLRFLLKQGSDVAKKDKTYQFMAFTDQVQIGGIFRFEAVNP